MQHATKGAVEHGTSAAIARGAAEQQQAPEARDRADSDDIPDLEVEEETSGRPTGTTTLPSGEKITMVETPKTAAPSALK